MQQARQDGSAGAQGGGAGAQLDDDMTDAEAIAALAAAEARMVGVGGGRSLALCTRRMPCSVHGRGRRRLLGRSGRHTAGGVAGGSYQAAVAPLAATAGKQQRGVGGSPLEACRTREQLPPWRCPQGTTPAPHTALAAAGGAKTSGGPRGKSSLAEEDGGKDLGGAFGAGAEVRVAAGAAWNGSCARSPAPPPYHC